MALVVAGRGRNGATAGGIELCCVVGLFWGEWEFDRQMGPSTGLPPRNTVHAKRRRSHCNPLRGSLIWRYFFGAAKVAVRWAEARYLAFWAFFVVSQVGRPKCAQKGEGGPSGGNFRRRRHLPSNRRGKRPRWPPSRRPSRAPTRTHTTRDRCTLRGGICNGRRIDMKIGTGVDLGEASAGRQSASPYLEN